MAKAVEKVIVPAQPPEVVEDPLNDAPREGRVIEVSVDGEVWERVKWYQTRVRRLVNGYLRMAPVAFWVTGDPYTMRRKIEFEPKHWRDVQ